MALYSFRCESCRRTSDEFRSFAASSDPTTCPCGGISSRVYTPPAVLYPGGGYSIGDADFPGGKERFHNTTLGEITRAQNNLPEVKSGELIRTDGVRHV